MLTSSVDKAAISKRLSTKNVKQKDEYVLSYDQGWKKNNSPQARVAPKGCDEIVGPALARERLGGLDKLLHLFFRELTLHGRRWLSSKPQ